MRTPRKLPAAVLTWTAVAAILPGQAAYAASRTPRPRAIAVVMGDLRAISQRIEADQRAARAAAERAGAVERSLRRTEGKLTSLRALIDRWAAQQYMQGIVHLLPLADGSTLAAIGQLEDAAEGQAFQLARARAAMRAVRVDIQRLRDRFAAGLGEIERVERALGRLSPATVRALMRGLTCPVLGRSVVASDFGQHRGNHRHSGNDIEAEAGQVVRAVLPAVVLARPQEADDAYGKVVIIRDAGGNQWWYAHLSLVSVRPGQRVRAGQMLGRVGCTGRCSGSHLHFELRPRGGAPRDPNPVLRAVC